MAFLSQPLMFWLIAAAMTVLALAFVLPYLFASRPSRTRARRTALNAAIGRSELAEFDRAQAEGVVTADQYAQARAEIERRLLADAADESACTTPRPAPRSATFALAVALPALAFGLYLLFGEPAALDANRAAISLVSPDASATTFERDALLRHLARQPRDGRGWVLLARMDFEADRFADAATDYGKAINTSAKVAADAGIWCEYADALGMAQGGTLDGQPLVFVMHALTLDPAHPKALEMAGSAAYGQRDYATAVRHWQQLLAQLPERSSERRELAAAIARAERMDVAASSAAAVRP